MSTKQFLYIVLLIFTSCKSHEELTKIESYQKLFNVAWFTTSLAVTAVANHYFLHNIGHGLALKHLVSNPKKITLFDIMEGKIHYKKGSLTKTEECKYYLAGPLLELGINLAYYQLMKRVSEKHPLLNGFKYGSLMGISEAVISLIPFKLLIPSNSLGIKSDGYHIMRRLQWKEIFLAKYLKTFK